MGDDEKRRKEQVPGIGKGEGGSLLSGPMEELFGVKLDGDTFKDLDSYDDRNFFAKSVDGKKEYLIKVHNGVDSENLIFITAQNNAMLTMKKNNLSSHVPLLSKNGEHFAFVHLAPFPSSSPSSPETRRHCLRLFEWLGGKMLCDWDLTDDLILEYGRFAGSVSKALSVTKEKGAERIHIWDMQNFGMLKDFMGPLKPTERRVVETATELFNKHVEANKDKFRQCVLHNDMNSNNFLVVEKDGKKEFSVLDFGDMVNSWLPIEISLAIAYLIIDMMPEQSPPYDELEEEEKKRLQKEVYRPIAPAFRGYSEKMELSEEEKQAVPALVLARIAMSLTMGRFSHSLAPENDYLLLTVGRGCLALQVVIDGLGLEKWFECFSFDQ